MGLPPVEIRMQLIDDKVKLKGVSETNQDKPILFDYIPPLGSGDGYAGIEMLTMSFAGCVSTAIIGLLKRRGKQVSGFEMEIKGIKCEEPLSLSEIEFTAIVDAADAAEADLSEIMMIAEKISPVWIAIRGNVTILGRLIKKESIA